MFENSKPATNVKGHLALSLFCAVIALAFILINWSFMPQGNDSNTIMHLLSGIALVLAGIGIGKFSTMLKYRIED